jgi:hypothetical protein
MAAACRGSSRWSASAVDHVQHGPHADHHPVTDPKPRDVGRAGAPKDAVDVDHDVVIDDGHDRADGAMERHLGAGGTDSGSFAHGRFSMGGRRSLAV